MILTELIWQLASPKWNFDDATFDRSAASFDNPDHVGIVIHNYRWRLALAEGEPEYADLDKRLAQVPVITVPTITLEGDANGAPHVEPGAYAKKFSGRYAHRLIDGRHRAQPAAGSAASLRPGRHRRRRLLIGAGTDDQQRCASAANPQRIISRALVCGYHANSLFCDGQHRRQAQLAVYSNSSRPPW